MNTRVFKGACTLCLVVYLLLLAKLIIFKYPDAMNHEILSSWSVEQLVRHISMMNFIPFKTISNGLFNRDLPVELTTLVYNIIAFVPLGFFVPCISEKTIKLTIILMISFMVSFAFEVVQVFTRLGSGDVDDIILNVTGAVIGYAVFKLISTRLRFFNGLTAV